ncbi:LCP family protein [Kibdelosporangium persicum]|uniref:Cell envelope-related transcriptional attenuator domain-containing protein n=1 Tax=Kibdelosporangium persicum TaxID=2698649 RepID=A0ABX2F4W2_9PSEU|nr:LCP family protein [Kibdelosporangium persicum]NRN66366.1 hypothetical protein [Kibdelosporangium persicum]
MRHQRDPRPLSGANLTAGRQTLNASQALAFVRQRHGLHNGDLDRTRRQQAFVAAVMHKVRSEGAALLPGLVDVAKQNVVVDEGIELFDFAIRMSNLTRGRMTYLTLPIERTETVDGESINIVDPHKVRAAVAEMLNPAPKKQEKPETAPPPADVPAAPANQAPAPIPCVD